VVAAAARVASTGDAARVREKAAFMQRLFELMEAWTVRRIAQ